MAFWLEWIDQRFYPSPYEIITAETLRDRDLWDDVWPSVRRLLPGFGIGAGLGIVVGTLTGASRWIRAALEPLLTALYTVPKLAPAASFRSTRWQTFRHVQWPAALPQIFVGLRLGSSVGVLILVGVELVLSSDGLGHIIEQGRILFIPQQSYVGIVLASLLGVVFSYSIRLIGAS